MKDKLYGYEYSLLIILSQIGGVFLISLQENILGKNAFFALIIGVLAGLCINIIFLFMLQKFNFASPSVVFYKTFGKYGRIFSFAYGIYFIFTCAMLLNFYGVFTVNVVLRSVPFPVFAAVICAMLIFGAMKGMMTAGRMATLFSFVLLPIVALSLLFGLPYIDGENLLPINCENGKDFFDLAFLFSFLQYGQIMSVFSLAGYVKNKKFLFVRSIKSLLIGGGIIAAFSLINALVLGDTLKMQYSGFLRVMQMVNIGSFINRMEALIIAAYFFATVFRLLVEFFTAWDNIKKSLLGKYSSKGKIRFIAICVGTAIYILCVSVPDNRLSTQNIYRNIFPYFAVVFQVIIPCAVIIINYAKKCLAKQRKKA